MLVKELTCSVLSGPRLAKALSCPVLLFLVCACSISQAADDLQDLALIAETAEQYALAETGLKSLNVSRLQVSANAIDPRLRLAACEHALEAFATSPGAGSDRMTVGVRCTGSKPWTLYVPVRVNAVIGVYTASRGLTRGHIPTADDLVLREMEMAKLPAGYIANLNDFRNKELTRNVRTGDILTPNMLRDARVISKGQRVIIQAASPGIEVKMAGVAMKPGVLGESIPVQNLSSGRTVQATIKDTETVIVGL